MLELYIGNKNYSSWSMRPWLVLKHFKISFKECLIHFDDNQSKEILKQTFKQTMSRISPTKKVPVLIQDDFVIWDSLAICEYLAEQYPHLQLWPMDSKQRAYARALCAEMHSGFQTLRQLCVMNIEADLAEIGQKLWLEHPQLQEDVQRIEAIWAKRLQQDQYLFEHDFSIADAFFAPIVMRLISYQLPVSEHTKIYMQQILTIPAVQQWITEAKAEKRFIQSLEPYRQST